MCNLNSLLNITFIQLSTRHDCFSLAHFHLIVISLWVFDGFHLPFLSANSISFSQFLTVLLQIFSPVPTLFSFILLDFFYFEDLLLRLFYLDALMPLMVYYFFPFLVDGFLLYLQLIFGIVDWKIQHLLPYSNVVLSSWKSFNFVSNISFRNYFVWGTFPFTYVWRNACWFLKSLF